MTTTIDSTGVQEYQELLFGAVTGGMLSLVIDLADRIGLLDELARGSGTSRELADRAGLSERYVRECLGALVTGRLVAFDPASGRFELPPAGRATLTGTGSANLAPMTKIVTLLAHHVDGVARAARTGGGVPYEAFRPEFTTVMDGLSRGLLDSQLLESMLPVTGLGPRLEHGVRVADIGCGTGHAVNLLARAYPRSAFVGYDLAVDAIKRARSEAADWALANARFEVLDVAELPADPGFDAILALDAIHDQADPAGVLRRVRDALVPGGVFVMMDIRASSRLQDNIDNPAAPLLYAISTLHCMTVSLAQGGAGLGAVWGEQLATAMLHEAGFTDVSIHEIVDDPLDSLYVCRTDQPSAAATAAATSRARAAGSGAPSGACR